MEKFIEDVINFVFTLIKNAWNLWSMMVLILIAAIAAGFGYSLGEFLFELTLEYYGLPIG